MRRSAADASPGVQLAPSPPDQSCAEGSRRHSATRSLDGQSGGFTSYWLTPDLAGKPSPHYPNWWTDDPDPALAEGVHPGAKTVSKWREEFLRDFAARMERCKAPAKQGSQNKE